MVQSNATQAFNNLNRRLTLAEQRADAELGRFAEELGNKFLAAMQQRQPDGSKNLDPMVLKGILNREPRPSIRQGINPIAENWVNPVVEKPAEKARIVRIKNKARHFHYFTTWTDRDYLGTRGGDPIVAKKTKTLAFWWKGAAHFPVFVKNHKGFKPKSDFVQDAWDSLGSYVAEQKKRMRGLVVETMKHG